MSGTLVRRTSLRAATQLNGVHDDHMRKCRCCTCTMSAPHDMLRSIDLREHRHMHQNVWSCSERDIVRTSKHNWGRAYISCQSRQKWVRIAGLSVCKLLQLTSPCASQPAGGCRQNSSSVVCSCNLVDVY